MKKHLRTLLALGIVAATLAAFTYYAIKHPETIGQISSLPPLILGLLLALYAIFFLALVLVTRWSLRAYNKHMPRQENLLFNAYSSLINFFGPGQSGPAFRGIYLKKRHGLEIKKYMFITLVYYACFAVLSAAMMFAGSRPWWQTVGLVLAVGGVSAVVIRRYMQRSKVNPVAGLRVKAIGLIAVATTLQLAVQAVIYGIELSTIGAGASIGQVLTYTGVANFALFVSLTPGAIGIREAFLVFSQQLHHIDASNIVAANVIDRGVYVLFLGLLFVLVMSLHAKDKLQISDLTAKEKEA